ncbi:MULTISPECIES: glycosyltransferase family 4 protein [unclassified Kocuria]|uniref:glycosyltransferase family 4 protein n=1 Tax=unclassified Kocuria TaxID=2649579 RepID=UPI000F87CF7B|nr:MULTISPECIES: glycosyltransferase family 4 protein [unclassified Kocuria]RUP84053.1 glycosyltransferase WbuB [Kocuria sp. HSID17590]RUQ06820.1 glycosyltransferase WbuB [Kocuria sp. HSID17582]
MAARILIIGLNYSPEHTGIAPYTAGMARALREEGWHVEVVTGLPHYPQWQVHEGYPRQDGPLEVIDGVPVRRIPHPVPHDAGQLRRLGMEIVFGLRAAAAPWGDPDVVVLITPALFASAILRVRAALTRTPVLVWVHDIYTAGLAETGAARGPVTRVMRAVEGTFLRSCNGVVVIHDRFSDYLRRHMGVAGEKITTVRNWTHIAEAPTVDTAALRRRFGWEPQDVVVLHTGNMGAKQDLANVAAAARVAEERGAPLRFVLVGGGHQRPQLEELAATTPRFEVLPSVDNETYAGLLRAADILLVNERPGLTEMCVPSKLTSYFTADRPVLAAVEAAGPSAAELAAADAGIRVEPGDPEALVAGAVRLHEEWITTGGATHRGGRRYVREVLSRGAAVRSFVSALTRLRPDLRAEDRTPATVNS